MGRLLDVKNLNTAYGKAQVLYDIDMHVGQGEFVSVIGSNGAGKTTLFNVISGLKSGQGRITFDGRTLPRKAHEVVGAGLIHCPEQRHLFPYMSVRDNLELGAYRHQGRGVQRGLDVVYALFPRLKERTDQLARTLSGGEQQMLAIGRALLSRPKLLLLDEPTIGLAPIVRHNISAALSQIKAQGITILLSEQNLVFALEHSDRIYLLETGRLTKEGTSEAFQQDDYVRKAYLGSA